MRQVKTATFVSLDGVMQAPGGPEEDPTGGFAFGGWVAPLFDEAVGGFIDAGMGHDYDLLLGRRTYEIFAAHWPYQPADDPIAVKFNAIRKYVACRAEEPLPWANSHRLGDDVAAAVAALKQTNGPDLLIQGSSVLIHSLLKADLIDQITTLTFPIALGSGKRLWPAGAAFAFTAGETETSPSGVVKTVYRRGGAVQTGSFTPPEPSAAEWARRARWEREA